MTEIKCKECGKSIPGVELKDKYVQCPHCRDVFSNKCNGLCGGNFLSERFIEFNKYIEY